MRYTAKPVKGRDYLLAAYFVVCATAVVWPGYQVFGNSLTPYVLGLPLSFAWNVGWVVVTFAVLIAYHLASGGEAS
jgi:hypothetical protein